MSDAAGAPRPKISAAVICLDEERNIGACLESLAWCDEIVVVDSGSRDRTVEIARKYATRVLHHEWSGYVAQKNWALEQTTGDWVLCLDADERSTPELQRAIEAALHRPANESPRTDQSQSPRFPRSEPQASGAVHRADARTSTTAPDPLVPRSEPQASGEAHQADARTSTTAPDPLVPRSEPQASGEAHRADSRTSTTAPDPLVPRSEPQASGEVHQTRARTSNQPAPFSEPQASGEIHEAGFAVRRHVFYLGRWIDHGGWYPDWKLRLVRRGRARWGGVDPHDKLIADGPVRRLDADLVHFTYGNFSDHLRTVQRFSDVVSEVQAREGHRFSLSRAILHPPAKFLECWLWKRGFLDGWPGFVIAVTSSFYVFAKYVKLWERTRNPAPDPRVPRSEPKASGEDHRAAVPTSTASPDPLVPRSEPEASGENHQARRSEPKASGEDHQA